MSPTFAFVAHGILGLALIITGTIAGDHGLVDVGIGVIAGSGSTAAVSRSTP